MKHRSQSCRAFSLIEVTLALGVVAVALLTIFGLLVTGTQVNHTAVEQSTSSDILTAVAADLRATPKTNPSSTQFGITIGTDATLYFNAAGQATAAGTARYRMKVTFPPSPGGRSAIWANLRMTWPAAADTDKANTSAAETFIALNRS